MKKFTKGQIFWFVVIVAVLGLIVWSQGGAQDSKLGNTTTVAYGKITQEVSVTGRVKSISEVALAFEKSGRIDEVYAVVGRHVARGSLLAELESSSAVASLMEAEARLAELKRGSRPEELEVKNAELAKYNQDLVNAYGGVLDTVSDAYNKADDAIHVKTAGIFSGFKTASYKFTYQICDSQLDLNGTWLRYTIEEDITTWRNELDAISSTRDPAILDQSLDRAIVHLEQTKAFLDAVNRTLTIDCTLSSSALDTYRTNITTARTNVVAALSAVNTKKQSIASLALIVAKAKNELSLLKAGTASEVVAAQEARVLAARGELSKHRIYAPIAGTITRVAAKIGEFSTVATPLINLIADSAFEIEANVPEADIAKIAEGDTVRITLDAYGSDVFFDGRVLTIDPAETIIDNVPTYKVTIEFAKNDTRIKSGMTANVDIATAEKDRVLVVPQRALKAVDGKKFVTRVHEDQTTEEVAVTTGLRGSDGLVEILSGVQEGDTILATPTE